MVFLRCGESFCVDLDSKSVQISFHKIHKDRVFLLYVFFGVSLKLKAGEEMKLKVTSGRLRVHYDREIHFRGYLVKAD